MKHPASKGVRRLTLRTGYSIGLAGLCTMASIGCGADEAVQETREPETAQVKQAYTELGTERTIPVRVINVIANQGDPYNFALNDTQKVIEEANEVYKAAGVQFYVSRIEAAAMPNFSVLYTEQPKLWSQVKNELKVVFPNLSLTAWSDGTSKTSWQWMISAASCYGPLHELIFWAHKTIFEGTQAAPGGTVNWGVAPDRGRAAVHLFTDTPGSYSGRNILSHEVGHTLGLPHTNAYDSASDSWGFFDSADQGPLTASDLWDLVYTPGTGGAANTFYTSRAAVETAKAQGKTFDSIHKTEFGVSNCRDIGSLCYQASPPPAPPPPGFNPSDGTIQCTVNGVTYTSGDANDTNAIGGPALKGLGFRGFANPTRGTGIMGPAGGCHYTTYSAWISDSQIEVVRKTLRYQAPLPAWAVALVSPPPGITLNTDRIYLGNSDTRRQGVWLDFDGDFKRDLAVWDPPASLDLSGNNPVLGKFRILTSRSGFASGSVVNFGVLGDVPMPSDYNGDGCTDIGVRRTSGPSGIDVANNTGYFVYCPSTGAPNCGTPNCANPRVATWGFRSDTPSPSPTFHGGPGEIAVFRPSDGTFYWRKFVSGGSNGGFPPPNQSASFGAARFLGVPLSGSDFDGDGKTDPTFWNIDTQNFEILPSASGYTPKWNRQFSATPLGMPLEGVGILTVSRPSNYQSGLWSTMWSVNPPSSVTTCNVGGNDDWPITAIDRDGDWRSDMVLFNGVLGRVSFKNSHGGDCAGAVKNVTVSSWKSQGMRVFGSFDISGDGKTDVIVIDPRKMQFFWLTSESDYSTLQSKFLGTQKSVPL